MQSGTDTVIKYERINWRLRRLVGKLPRLLVRLDLVAGQGWIPLIRSFEKTLGGLQGLG